MKRVGITTGHFESALGFYSNGVNKQYQDLVLKSGCIPVVIPIIESDIDKFAKEIAESVDLLLLTGGSDITPILYDEIINSDCGDFDLARDIWELKLIEKFKNLNKPIMGICRGLQLLNVSFGGTLNQHMDNQFNKHWHNIKRPFQQVHEVKNLGDTLVKYLGNKIMVNSFHHQCIDKLSPELEHGGEIGISNDNVIEMLYHKELKILGVQYHPEMMPDAIETDILMKLFLSLDRNLYMENAS